MVWFFSWFSRPERFPASSEARIIIPPVQGSTSCYGGLFASYSEEYPAGLKPYMDEKEFNNAITSVNDAIIGMWPCCLCQNFGYYCCICTVGLSYLIPCGCILEAERQLHLQLRKINERCKFKGIQWVFVQKHYTSWIEVRTTKSNHEWNKAL